MIVRQIIWLILIRHLQRVGSVRIQLAIKAIFVVGNFFACEFYLEEGPDNIEGCVLEVGLHFQSGHISQSDSVLILNVLIVSLSDSAILVILVNRERHLIDSQKHSIIHYIIFNLLRDPSPLDLDVESK